MSRIVIDNIFMRGLSSRAIAGLGKIRRNLELVAKEGKIIIHGVIDSGDITRARNVGKTTTEEIFKFFDEYGVEYTPRVDISKATSDVRRIAQLQKWIDANLSVENEARAKIERFKNEMLSLQDRINTPKKVS